MKLSRNDTALLIVDMQDRVLAAVERGQEVLDGILKILRGFQILGIPIVVSEQCPQALGETTELLKRALGNQYRPWKKSTFSALGDEALRQHVLGMSINNWVLVGIEAHICVLQTAKDLMEAGKGVVVLNDAITSRSIFDFSTAIAEMRDEKVRISSVETVLFELLEDAKAPEFKAISREVKGCCGSCK